MPLASVFNLFKKTVPVSGDKLRSLQVHGSVLALAPVLLCVAVVAKDFKICGVKIGSVAVDVVDAERSLVIFSAPVTAERSVLFDGCGEANDGVFFLGVLSEVKNRRTLAPAKDTQPPVHLIAPQNRLPAYDTVTDLSALSRAIFPVVLEFGNDEGFATRFAIASDSPRYPETSFRAKGLSKPFLSVLALELSAARPTSVHGDNRCL
jgi:hypothetical protein